jgi:hypothetical protein
VQTARYSIKDIETLSRIKAHTLRIWEQRYGFLKPERTDTNIRYYSDEQLKAILNIALLNKNGHKISHIADMTAEEVKGHVLKISNTLDTSDALLDSMTHAMVDFDEYRFENTINAAIEKLGFKETFVQLLLPFLERTGILWTTGMIKPVQEHFVSNLIRRKLCVAIDNINITKTEKTKKFVLFLPEGEWHEMMLLFTELLLRLHNHEVTYIGCSLPFSDIGSLGTFFKPDYLVTYLTAPLQEPSLQSFVNSLGATFANIPILIGGPQIAMNKPKLPRHIQYVKSMEDLLIVANG